MINTIILSNGTQVLEVRKGEVTEAIVQPDGRAMNESEWNEYVDFTLERYKNSKKSQQ